MESRRSTLSGSHAVAGAGNPATVFEELLGLRPGVFMASNGRTLYLFRRELWRSDRSFGSPSEVKRTVLTRLAESSCTLAELSATAGPDAEVSAFVGALHARGWLAVTVRRADCDLYTVQPLRAPSPAPGSPVDDPVLSRLAVVHRVPSGLVVEAPLANARVLVHDPAMLALLPGAGGEHATVAVKPDDALRDRFVRDLWAAGLLVSGSMEEPFETRQWRTHELWFHARSRSGNGGYDGTGFGRTRWASSAYKPLPARPEPYRGPAVELHRPDLAELRRSGPSLAAVMEERCSVRQHDEASPMTARQLGELLYRCARTRRTFHIGDVEHVSRPYPSGGGVYELELYPVIRRVSGLDAGMYHYESVEHRLRLVREPGPHVEALLRVAASAAMTSAQPQALLVIAARFGRLAYTYEEIPYSLVLKHTGVLYQSIYLVATAMGLAPCGLGGGDVMAFAAATGRDIRQESAVGEFMLGSRIDDVTAQGDAGEPVAST